MTTSADKALVRELELAQATQNREYAAALRRQKPESGAGVLEVAGGFGIQAGPGSPLTQGLAIGLSGPVSEAELQRLEEFLGRGSGPVQLELVPDAVDASFVPMLEARGYRLTEQQHTLIRSLAEPLPELRPTPVVVRTITPDEAERWSRTLGQGFSGQEDVPPELAELSLPTAASPSNRCYAAFLDGEMVGAGTLGRVGRVAVLSGTGVRAPYRRRGAQGALIRARLEAARQAGAEYAACGTLPDSDSQHNMERYGFRVLYRKAVYVRQPGA